MAPENSHDPSRSPSEETVTLAGHEEAVGIRIGPYKVLGLLGEGGFGVVYLAEQTKPVQRRVALKVIKPGMDTRAVLARFEAEQQALALMDHPNVAHVYDAGTTEPAAGGRPYFVMEHVTGVPITEHCDRHRLSINERLGLFMQVCEAVQHAHQKGVIHRDIKPTNILVSVQDVAAGVPAGRGQPGAAAVPKVIDFGVAKAISQPLTQRTLFTEEGQLIGTPAYMSPEQAEMTAQDIDTRTDIYSLGVLLYELLTGALPFDPKSLRSAAFGEIQRMIREVEPQKPSTKLSSVITAAGDDSTTAARNRRADPRTLTRELRGDLDWITMKALDKDRTRRYSTASELAADIARHLSDEPVLASPPSARYRLKKALRKHRGVVTAAAALTLALSLGLVVSTLMYLQAEAARDLAARAEAAEREQRVLAAERAREAEEAQQVAETLKTTAQETAESVRRRNYAHSLANAQSAHEHSRMRRMKDLLFTCPPDMRGWEWYYLVRLSDRSTRILRGHEGWIRSVAISTDGKQLVSGSFDHTVRLWDTDTGENIRTQRCPGRVWSVAMGPDGRWAASGEWGGTVWVWDAEAGGNVLVLRGHEGAVQAVAFSPDGRRIASGGDDRTVRIWDADTGVATLKMEGHDGVVRAVAFSPDGRRIASGGDDKTVRIWDADTGVATLTMEGHDGAVRAVAFSPDGRRIASGSEDKTIRLWDPRIGARLLPPLIGHRFGLRSVAFSPDGKLIASGGQDRTLRLWDAATGREVHTLRGHEFPVRSAAFHPHGGIVVSASEDHTLRFWDIDTVPNPLTWPGQTTLAMSPDGNRFLSVNRDYSAPRVWDVRAGPQAALPLRGHATFVECSAFSADGARIVTGDSGSGHPQAPCLIQIWDSATGERISTLAGHRGPVSCVAFSNDGRWVVSGSKDGTVRIWEADTGAEVRTLRGSTGAVRSVTFSPDGRWVAAGGEDKAVRVWNAHTGANKCTLSKHEGTVQSVAFSPDGGRLVSGGNDCTLRVWDTAIWKQVFARRTHEYDVVSVSLSPDGRRIASGGQGTAKLWDTETGQEVLSLSVDQFEAVSVAFSSTGSRLALMTGRRGLTILDATTQEQVESNPEAALQFARGAAGLTEHTRYDEAEVLLLEAWAIYERTTGLQDLQAQGAARQLARLYDAWGKPEQAAQWRAKLPPPEQAGSLIKLGMRLLEDGRHAEAEAPLGECLEIRQEALPKGHWLIFNTMSVLGESLAGQGADPSLALGARIEKLREAEPLLLEGYEGMKDHPTSRGLESARTEVRGSLERIVKLYDAWHAAEPDAGYDAQAAEWRAKLEQWQATTQPAAPE